MQGSLRLAGHPSSPAMSGGLTKKSLSPQQQSLLMAMQTRRYGRIPVLRIAKGEPVLSDVGFVRTVKVAGDNSPHPASTAEDFALRREVVEFFRLIAAVGDGEIRNLEIRNGLPFTFEVHETLRV